MSWWRYPVAGLGAVLSALGLFWVMQAMLLHPAAAPREVRPVAVMPLPRAEPNPPRSRPRPSRPTAPLPALASIASLPRLAFAPDLPVPRAPVLPRPRLEAAPSLDTEALLAGLAPAPVGNPAVAEPNADLVPLVRIPPRYPSRAALDGVEGWVKVELTITKTGAVEGARVVAAEPRRVFDRAALKAISRWRFRPRIVDGRPVAQRAVQVLEFRLDS